MTVAIESLVVRNAAFGERIRTLRKDRGETLDQVASATSTSRSTLSRVELGSGAVPRGGLVYRLARHFGVPVEELLKLAIESEVS